MLHQALARSLIIGCAIGTLGAMEVAVDQPHAWYDPGASHHGKHGLGGMAIGAIAFTATDLVTDSRPASYAMAIGASAFAGIAYEVRGSRNGVALCDPVDAAWVIAGGAAGAAISDLTGQAVSLMVTPHQASSSIAFRW